MWSRCAEVSETDRKRRVFKGAGPQSDDIGPRSCTSLWLHEQKASLRFQSAINAQHRLASEISAEAHHGTLKQKAA
ncbi:MAG: hypothetical protein ACI8S6_005718 [Myxococcota bacterium]|jgi:hypothetical protein